ncbi:MAG: glycosyltransferase family 4 protein [Candidatus Taylorbacteria bacterium]
MSKTRIAFIKFDGLSVGGSELWIQKMAANLPKEHFEVDYFYCDVAPLWGTDYVPGDTDPQRLEYMRDNKINLIKFNVKAVDYRFHYHPWIETDFWDLFDPKKYDLVQTIKAGPKEYPFYLIDLPTVEIVALANRPDKSRNIAWSFHSSSWQRNVWLTKGGSVKRSSVLSAPLNPRLTTEDYRSEFNIPKDALVAGFHQRADDNIWSSIPLNAFSKLQNPNWHFIIKGGGGLYRKQAEELHLKNVHFLPSDGDSVTVSKFLNTLDIFAHGRRDGETFGAVFAEAIIHGKPCLSHSSDTGLNAQKETMGSAGLFADGEKDYTEKLYSLFNDKKLRDALTLEAKNSSNTYSIQKTVESVIAVYEEVLKDPSRFRIRINFISKTRDFIISYMVFLIKYVKHHL